MSPTVRTSTESLTLIFFDPRIHLLARWGDKSRIRVIPRATPLEGRLQFLAPYVDQVGYAKSHPTVAALEGVEAGLNLIR